MNKENKGSFERPYKLNKASSTEKKTTPKASKFGHKAKIFKKKEVALGAQSRVAAALCVNAIEEGTSLSEALPLFTKDLDERDKAFVQEIVYGTLRHRRLLSVTANALFDHSINQKFNAARTLIICAIYQLIFTRAPAHAIVAATVGACDLCKCKSLTGMVNAVLRRFLREGGHLLHSSDPCIEQSFPKWLYEKLEQDYGKDQVVQIMINSNEHAPMFLRVENSKISSQDYVELLNQSQISGKVVEEFGSCVLLEKPVNVNKLPKFFEGYVCVQDLAAQLASPLLELKDNERVLDTCCAPGGKSAHILDLATSIKLTCCDINEKRLESAKETLNRLNRSAEFMVADFSGNVSQIEGQFDKILVDAPCSGTGVIRRHPDIKWLRRQKDIEALTNTQQKILDNAFDKLKPGGILVYTTCSILKAENEEQVKNFLARHANAKILPFKMHDKQVDWYQRLPGDNQSDGFFYSRFIKD